MGTHARGDEVQVSVTGFQHYGVLVETDAGEAGWIEAEYLSNQMLTQDDWPGVGTSLRGLVLGYTADDRIRVCLREVDGRPSPDTWPPSAI